MNNKSILKKAAMFGLDARIALAIFGALSVISGAALYSAISNAKVTAIVYEVNELSKSVEQYYFDNFSYPMSGTYLSAIRLTTNSLSLTTWNGPYTSLSEVTATRFIKSASNPDMLLSITPISLANYQAGSRAGCDLKTTKCALISTIRIVKSDTDTSKPSIFTQLEENYPDAIYYTYISGSSSYHELYFFSGGAIMGS
tara:strand:+ start:516 stop:1112 length:597 start_codon:yes stop_codon:yes gene_type:complete